MVRYMKNARRVVHPPTRRTTSAGTMMLAGDRATRLRHNAFMHRYWAKHNAKQRTSQHRYGNQWPTHALRQAFGYQRLNAALPALQRRVRSMLARSAKKKYWKHAFNPLR